MKKWSNRWDKEERRRWKTSEFFRKWFDFGKLYKRGKYSRWFANAMILMGIYTLGSILYYYLDWGLYLWFN